MESSQTLLGRAQELQRLRVAVRKRESQLIWGPPDSGKTSLIQHAIGELPEKEKRKCVYWSGPASGRQLVSHFIRQLYLSGDPLVRKKVHADRAAEATLNRWINGQSLLRLRGILFSAAEQGDYLFFLDHLPPPSLRLAHWMKEIMYRSKTPIYMTGHGYSMAEIGYAWSLYWTHEYRIHVEPLTDAPARALLELCIQKFGLTSLDLEGFRKQILHLSGHLPGSIVKMCELAANPRYRFGDQVKIKLVHVDYLMRAAPHFAPHAPGLAP